MPSHNTLLHHLGKFSSSTRTTSTGAPLGCVLSPLLFSLYTNNCTSKDPSVKLLKFADDTTLIGLIQDGDESAYRQEVKELAVWCSLNNLELNTLKTMEMIVDFRRNPPALPPLTIMNMLPVSDAEKLVHAFMTSRLDYCNALLGGCPASSINKLQVVQNAAARVLTRLRKYDHITPILQSLHWLPIKFRISYKILLLAYKALNGLAPAYLTSLLSRYNPSRCLRSQNSGLLVVPRIAKSTKGGRAFSYLAPKLWNSLPDNVRGSDTLSLFKSR